MKKILIATNSLGLGGVPKALLCMLKVIDYNQYDVTLRVLHDDDFFMGDLPHNVKLEQIKFPKEYFRSVVTTNIPYLKKINNLFGRIVRGIYTRVLKFKIHGMYPVYCEVAQKLGVEEEKYDLAVDYYGYGSFLTVYISKCINASKKVTWIHDEAIGENWLNVLDSEMLNFDQIFCVSNVCNKKLVNYFPNNHKISVFFNIVDSTEIITKSNEYVPDFDRDTINLVTVGRLHPQKGYDIAIDIAKILKKQNISFKWYFIGEGGQRDKLEKSIQENDLCDVIKLTGSLRNPYPYMKYSDIYVQPSRHEGYALTMEEAIILKKVIVASKILPFVEVIGTENNAVLVDLDSDIFARAIMQLITDKNYYNMLQMKVSKMHLDFSNEINKLYELI